MPRATHAMNATAAPDVLIGVVVIGRNEGERLRASLSSVVGRDMPVVYVDSGSQDGSPELARALGCDVLELDPARPFSAARARNEGLARLAESAPEVAYVQLLDGDTVLLEGWIPHAAAVLGAHSDVCAVIGRLREAHPEHSIYNRVCGLEWNLPPGEIQYFGGNVLARLSALQSVGGFVEGLIAGEEPEFAQRLRAAGWRIRSESHDMAVHDAAISSFGQWLRRGYRAGYGNAQLCSAGSGIRGRLGLRQSLRVWFWVVVLPLTAFVIGAPSGWLVVLGLYILQLARIAMTRWRQGHGAGIALFYALSWLPSMVAQWLGQLRFLLDAVTGRRPTIIEYKTKPTQVSDA